MPTVNNDHTRYRKREGELLCERLSELYLCLCSCLEACGRESEIDTRALHCGEARKVLAFNDADPQTAGAVKEEEKDRPPAACWSSRSCAAIVR